MDCNVISLLGHNLSVVLMHGQLVKLYVSTRKHVKYPWSQDIEAAT